MGSKKKTPRGRPRKTDTPLSRWLDREKISRDAFAEMLGIHRSTVDRLCRNERRPNITLAFEIEKVTKGAVPASSWAAVPPHSKD